MAVDNLALILALKGAKGGGGGEPSEYLKTINKDTTNKEITIKDKTGTETTFNYDDYDYESLDNKPQINGNDLVGDQSTLDLGIFDVKSGTTIPSGEEIGQLFLLTQDVGTVKKGLYRYNGSTWDLSATAGATFETYEWETTLSNGDIIYEETIKGE